MTHPKAKLQINGNNTSPCFKPFLHETCRPLCLPRLFYKFHLDTFISLTISWGYQTQREYYSRPPTQLNLRIPWILSTASLYSLFFFPLKYLTSKIYSIQITNQMQQFSSFWSWRLFTAQHVSGVILPIIRRSVTAVAASGFTFVSWW